MNTSFEIEWLIHPKVGEKPDACCGRWSITWPQESFRDAKFHPIWDHAAICPDCSRELFGTLTRIVQYAHVPELLWGQYLDDIIAAQVDAMGRVMLDPDVPHEKVRASLAHLFETFHRSQTRRR